MSPVLCHTQIYNVLPLIGPLLKNWRILMSNLERRIEDNMSIIADLKSSWDPSVGRCFVDVFLNRQLKVQVSESRLLLLMAQRELVSRPVRSLLSSEVTNRELALPRAKPGQQFDGPVCRRDGHNFSHTAVVFAVHGQVPSFSRCKKNPKKRQAGLIILSH